jgi:hypothetical protein
LRLDPNLHLPSALPSVAAVVIKWWLATLGKIFCLRVKEYKGSQAACGAVIPNLFAKALYAIKKGDCKSRLPHILLASANKLKLRGTILGMGVTLYWTRIDK